jgi:hypothetical protein
LQLLKLLLMKCGQHNPHVERHCKWWRKRRRRSGRRRKKSRCCELELLYLLIKG